MTDHNDPEKDKYAKLFKELSENPKTLWSDLKLKKLVTSMELNDLARKGYILAKRDVSYSIVRSKQDFEELDMIREEVKTDEHKLRKLRGIKQSIRF